MRILSALLLLALSIPCAAQRIGTYTIATNGSTVNLPQPNTVVDLNAGATSAGSIGAVAVRLLAHECPGNAFKVKFFRRSGDVLTMTAERGPFALTNSHMVIPMTPPVAVQQGDLLGITELASCAPTVGQASLTGAAYHFEGDVTTADLNSPTAHPLPAFALSAYGAENVNAEVLTQVILVAGAAQGSGGSSFKTDLFLTNLRQGSSQGRIVYHPAATSGSAGDPSFAFTVDPLRTAGMPNFVASRLGLTGVGSVDIYTKIGFDAPTASVRIYDDAGAGGTKGFTLDAVTPSTALEAFENAALFAPQDTRRFRMNLGIRTLEASDIQFFLWNSSGTLRASTTRSYPANYFVQGLVRDFLGLDPNDGDMITVYSQQKSFFAYGSIIDNTTNDPSVQVAKHLK